MQRDRSDAIEALLTTVVVPSRRGPILHSEKLRRLAVEWPDLAARLGTLAEVYDRDVPASLRRAMMIVRREMKT
jgi:hypothetical protein